MNALLQHLNRASWNALPLCLSLACTGVATRSGAEETLRLAEVEIHAAPFSNAALSTPAIETFLAGETLRHCPAHSLDGILRSVPGFRLFRRTDSTTAHPTTQGVSLGYVGPNGASRSLVLLDGIPMNDPFGGWIAWNRFLPNALSAARLVPQAGVTPWGSASLGGVVALDSRFLNEPPFAFAEASAGNALRQQTAIAFAQDTATSRTRIFGGLQETHFAGYPVLRKNQRGPVDIYAASRSETFDVGMRERFAPENDWHLTLRAQGWQEQRNNGTPLTPNSSNALDFSARLHRDAGPQNWALESILFTQERSFKSLFSSVATDRSSEKPSLDQYAVPCNTFGFIQRLRFPLENGHSLGTGLDLRTSEGLTKERFKYVGTAFTQEREAGGRQHDAGIFLQDTWRFSPHWQFHGASRLEWHDEREGHLREWEILSHTPLRNLHSENNARLTPHFNLGTQWTPSSRLQCSASAYTGARNPTLNELYRPFRAGDVVTLANPALRQESILGGEIGAKITPFAAITFQLRAFENRLKDAIANVNAVRGPGTIGDWGFLPTGGIGARRENLDSVALCGWEAQMEWKLDRMLTMATGWLETQSTVRHASVQPSLEGKRLPQIPSHQASLQLSGETALWRWDIRLRWISRQFDDDANQSALNAYCSADLRLTRRMGLQSEFFVMVENLNNTEVQTRRDLNGIVSVGAPRTWSTGVRYNF